MATVWLVAVTGAADDMLGDDATFSRRRGAVVPIGERPKVVVAEEFRVEFVRSDIANTEATH